jgi:hypothetical protein
LIPPEELRHLSQGPRAGEVPGGVGLVEVYVSTGGSASDLFSRCREVVRAALVEAAGQEWPSVDAWSQKLPGWFVRACAAEESAEEAARWLTWWRGLDDDARVRAARERPWSLPDWLHWLQPDERQWYWWDAIAHGAHEGRVLVEVPAWPTALGALEWLLRVAGADRVDVVENLLT